MLVKFFHNVAVAQINTLFPTRMMGLLLPMTSTMPGQMEHG